MSNEQGDNINVTPLNVPVSDPYQWLEEDEQAATRAWEGDQAAATASHLRRLAGRGDVRDRLTELWDYARPTPPGKVDHRYFSDYNSGLQNQPVTCVQDHLGGAHKVILDPNTFAKDGTIAVSGTALTGDGSLLAYRLQKNGSDWEEIRVRDTETLVDYDDVLRWCKFTSIVWAPDNSGFFYNRCPEPGTVPPGEENASNLVYWHTLGTTQAEDRLIYEEPQRKELSFLPGMTEDGRYFFLRAWIEIGVNTGFYYREAQANDSFTKLLADFDAVYDFAGNVGHLFYFRTNLDAPRFHVIAIDVREPERNRWREIVGENDDVLAFAKVVGGHLVACSMRDAQHHLTLYSLDGEHLRGIGALEGGSIPELNLGNYPQSELSSSQHDPEIFFSFTSFLRPPAVYRYDTAADDLTALEEPEGDFDAELYETTEIFYPSKDGTQIHMFLTHRKGIELDSPHPTLLYGYGGFNVNLMPAFSPARLLWLEAGGIYAVANLRGGGEYGEEWHEAGKLGNKQNVFDDFISAGEWLISNGYTRRELLAINGGSNGGLLTAACLTQRPDLWGAVVCEVPVTDMLRFQRFTRGRFWTYEWGNSETSAEHFEFLRSYSPVHNVSRTVYPPTLITTADTDDRVVPGHARKFAATLQESQTGDAPILLRIESKAGHSHGKPTSKQIDEAADIYTFLFDVFNMEVPR
jgi:prolyl oligopeptidase